MRQHFTITGTGAHLPRSRLTAEDVDHRAGLAPGWTREHIGVLNRHECAAPETLASMAQSAITEAMHSANVAWSDIDLIIDGSTSLHQPIPCNAAYLHHCIGPAAEGIPTLDVHGTCLGFVLAMQVANGLFAVGNYRHILIVCSEMALTGVNWAEPDSCCLMGDGAAAAVLRRAEPGPTFFFAHETFSQHFEACQIRGGGLLLPVNHYTTANEPAYRFHMDGPRLVQAACKHLPPMIEKLLKDADLAMADLHVIPHQAAPKALTMVRRLLHARAERYHNRVAQIGNIVAASIPLVLHQCRQERLIVPGDNVLLLGTSAGYSQAGLIFRS